MTYHIITYGCQMNENDSRRIAHLLQRSGFKKASEKKCDFLIMNACSVRGRVVDRIRGKINQLSKEKTLILTGCVLEKDRNELKKSFDYILDIENLTRWHKKVAELEKITDESDYFQVKAEREKPTAYIPIMTGCDNFCSYCAVPYVRGRERSRPEKEIIEEVSGLIKRGFKEIWLLGQNVNSYNKNGKSAFPDLLESVNNIRGDFWIRFTSSHPKDFSDKLIEKMKSCEKVTNYLNLPLQSGDDEILKRMNRPYDTEKYKKTIKKIKKEIPGITLSTDIIVGFPGETKKAFLNTKKMLEEIKFDMAYIARYSPRPHTKAAQLKDSVTDKEKKKRAKELTEVLKKTALKNNRGKIGKRISFLAYKSEKGTTTGKTEGYKTIKVEGDLKEGKFYRAEVIKASSFGLKGKFIKNG